MISDHDVERVARIMCEEMGLDPDEIIPCEYVSTCTPYETPYINLPRHVELRTDDGRYIRLPTCNEPPMHYERWKTFRRDAARALAGWRAVNKYVMTEL